MVCFQTKNPNLGKFWMVFQQKMLVHLVAIWSILWLFGIFNGQWVYFLFIWYIFPILVICSKKNMATLLRRGC
jgi:hypothetical protein